MGTRGKRADGWEGKKVKTQVVYYPWIYLREDALCVYFSSRFLRYGFFFLLFSSAHTLPSIDHDLLSRYDSTVPGCFLTLIIAASWFTTGAILSVGSSGWRVPWCKRGRRRRARVRLRRRRVRREARRRVFIRFFFTSFFPFFIHPSSTTLTRTLKYSDGLPRTDPKPFTNKK